MIPFFIRSRITLQSFGNIWGHSQSPRELHGDCGCLVVTEAFRNRHVIPGLGADSGAVNNIVGAPKRQYTSEVENRSAKPSTSHGTAENTAYMDIVTVLSALKVHLGEQRSWRCSTSFPSYEERYLCEMSRGEGLYSQQLLEMGKFGDAGGLT